MRDTTQFFLNGSPIEVGGREALAMLAPWLRSNIGLTGTKIACAQGACGSCSVLLGRPTPNGFDYAPINSCIFPVYNCDGCHVITVEGLNGPELTRGQDTGELSAVQNALVACHGAQCGFCTPGIAITLTALHQTKRGDATKEEVERALEGNLCRCTGYASIIESGLSVDAVAVRSLDELYPPQPLLEKWGAIADDDVKIIAPRAANLGAQTLFSPREWQAALDWKARHPNALIVAGATEIGVSLNATHEAPPEILSLARVEGADEITLENGVLALGARATWAQLLAFDLSSLPELSQLLNRWASPQLRRVGTVAGNIVKASSISDSLPFLLVCGAQIELESARGTRRVGIEDWLKNPTLAPDELLRRVQVSLPAGAMRIYKVTKRRAFARSIVSGALVLEARDGKIESVRMAFGGVGERALRLRETENWLRGQPLESATWREAGRRAQSEIAPVSDGEASEEYRRRLVGGLLRKFGSEIGGHAGAPPSALD